MSAKSGAWKTCAGGALIAQALETAVLPGRARAACKISSVEMPVTMVGSRAVATLGIHGSTIRMIVDSGAIYSSLTHAAARKLQPTIGAEAGRHGLAADPKSLPSG